MPRIGNKSAPTGELTRELAGGTISGDVAGANYIVSRIMQVPLTGGSTGTQAFSIQNPESVPLAIKSIVLAITTAGSGSAALDIGIVASSSKVASDVGDSADIANAGIIPVTLGATASRWEKNGNSSDAWLTAQTVTQESSDLVGYALIEVVPIYSS